MEIQPQEQHKFKIHLSSSLTKAQNLQDKQKEKNIC